MSPHTDLEDSLLLRTGEGSQEVQRVPGRRRSRHLPADAKWLALWQRVPSRPFDAPRQFPRVPDRWWVRCVWTWSPPCVVVWLILPAHQPVGAAATQPVTPSPGRLSLAGPSTSAAGESNVAWCASARSGLLSSPVRCPHSGIRFPQIRECSRAVLLQSGEARPQLASPEGYALSTSSGRTLCGASAASRVHNLLQPGSTAGSEIPAGRF